MRKQAFVSMGIGAVALGVIGIAANLVLFRTDPAPPPPPSSYAEVPMPTCAGAATPAGTPIDNPEARGAAQRGLDFLAKEATAWGQRHSCYGCHVQAVTLEAFAVGRHHQYRIADTDLAAVLRGMLDHNGGARTAGGLHHGSSEIGATGKLLGGAAFARYDQWIDGDLRDFLTVEAEAILAAQQDSGAVPMPWTSPPVATGPIQATAHAITTWKQAYERTADDRWLTAIQKAEGYLRGVVQPSPAGWRAGSRTDSANAPRRCAPIQPAPLGQQELAYAALGLVGAGVGAGEDVLVHVRAQLLERQNDDGGWGPRCDAASEALTTGQALYTLRMLGMTDRDPAVSRGTAWLIARQAQDGGWSHAGFGKAEAMWAVLGLVSIDVLTVAVTGVRDGQRVSGDRTLEIEARDNHGGGVAHVEIFVDDLRVHGACGATTAWTLAAAKLQPGRHTVDVRATNARGEVSRRRLEVFAGDVFMTQVGTSFHASETRISLRDIGEDTDGARTIALEVARDGKVVHTATQPGRQGPIQFTFRGDPGEYVATLRYTDAAGAVRQVADARFVHATEAYQQANYAQLEGALALPEAAAAANAELELVDEDGKVVARTLTTKTGNWRFKNVAAGKDYRVRVKKDGFEAADAPAPVRAVKGKPQKVDMVLKKK